MFSPSAVIVDPVLQPNGQSENSSIVQRGAPLKVNPRFKCPITHFIMREPVVASDGKHYEKDAIQDWIDRKVQSGQAPSSPHFGNQIKITANLIDNLDLRDEINEFIAAHPQLLEEREELEQDNREYVYLPLSYWINLYQFIREDNLGGFNKLIKKDPRLLLLSPDQAKAQGYTLNIDSLPKQHPYIYALEQRASNIVAKIETLGLNLPNRNLAQIPAPPAYQLAPEQERLPAVARDVPGPQRENMDAPLVNPNQENYLLAFGNVPGPQRANILVNRNLENYLAFGNVEANDPTPVGCRDYIAVATTKTRANMRAHINVGRLIGRGLFFPHGAIAGYATNIVPTVSIGCIRAAMLLYNFDCDGVRHNAAILSCALGYLLSIFNGLIGQGIGSVAGCATGSLSTPIALCCEQETIDHANHQIDDAHKDFSDCQSHCFCIK